MFANSFPFYYLYKMNEIIWNDKCIKILIDAVEYDLVRYSDDNMFTSLLETHRRKFNYFIYKGRFKTQENFEKFLLEYREFFKSISEPDNGIF